MVGEQNTSKRGRGRPRIHKGEPKTLSIRTTEKRFDLINGLLATIRLAERRTSESTETLILEALEQRVRGLENQNPALVRDILRALDKNRQT